MSPRRGRRKKPFALKLKRELVHSMLALFFGFLGIITLLSFSSQGLFLETLRTRLDLAFGWTSLFLPALFLSLSLILTGLKWSLAKPEILLGTTLLFLGFSGITQAGVVGFEIFTAVALILTTFGAIILYAIITLAGFMLLSSTSLADLLLGLAKIFQNIRRANPEETQVVKPNLPKFDPKINIGQNTTPPPEQPPEPKDTKPKDSFEAQLSHTPTGQIWKYPTLNLLSESKGEEADRGDVKANAQIIESTLDSFGIKARVSEINGGPAVTQYAIKIASGTKLSRIKALSTDLALALAAPTGQIRIEAPIPGRDLVGIEIPNRSAEFVTLRKILQSAEMKKTKSKLAVGLGLDVSGNSAVADIRKMPHVLVAGSTGSGKSVCINTIITTLLFRNSPAELKLILVDPKRVELTGYNGIPHLLTPVITEAERVVSALQWCTKEMDRRYKMCAEVGARNLEDYNEIAGFASMEYIVIVIDELADIMLYAPGKVEDLITRLAQMSRAVGIHLVLATQRPSVNVITGLIKANIPTRISFNVTSMIDSRVIIDQPGAEKLLGKGDMLYVPSDRPTPLRIQGTFVTDQEIKKLIDFLKQNAGEPVHYQEEVTEKYLAGDDKEDGTGGEQDELFEAATQVVISAGKASTSYLQRRLSVGYNRAAKLMDQLEAKGIIGPADGIKPRTILVTHESWEASQNT
jgi:DNA segregation ATPase FtsK/SpoIIIE, S-DNA-T family